ncbi:diguanylate cyclase (GGDEF)-like protein [Microbacterium ginsengiterrae]|uniref:Diguanylate cyclase (GGDEF)-like protein n=1 Tax=Microbacterium ginsengiterrae TaxID=546115 RepID=A0A7W9CE68_9MICO|nr:sensor domain-containing diguanylate cyclase [Microbacterium ginsengiterrae]MBB5743985.1 diguanylate cyclase (GGDEF)-like protein [Microbacterium ginsengiterrae]
MTELFALSPEESARRTSDESARLTECAAEPIRMIGRVQSHGILLGLDEPSGTVVLASANAEDLLGRVLRDEHEDLGRIVAHSTALDPAQTEFEGRAVDVMVHRGSSPLLVEIEPTSRELEYTRTGAVSAIQRLAEISELDELYVAVAREIKALSGFERVMVYEFHADGHGQVVADEREPDMEPYFGLHFPASDIPSQARALYIEKRSRVIADTEDPGVPILTLLAEEAPIDLGPTELRASSPHHLTFMRNMGQAATFSLSLVVDGNLVGMITCAHRTPRRLPVLLRRALEVLAGQLSLQMGLLRRIHHLERDIDAQRRRSAVMATLYERSNPGEALTTGERTMLDIVPSDGALVRLKGVVHTVGVVPPPSRLFAIIDALGPGGHALEALPLTHPEAAATVPGVAGLLVVPLGDGGDCIVYVRSEVTQTVEWLGDQRPENRDHALSPRRSFSAWRESVTGRSLPWGILAQDAQDFGRALRGALDARAQAELADLALQDPLTGLHNRRFLEGLLGGMEGEEAARLTVIFFDIDEFKSINDVYGHSAGDLVLSVIAERLQSAVRSGDAVVRLGGDEFVIACPETEVAEAEQIATRALQAIGHPIEIHGESIIVRASAGVVSGGAGGDILTSADAAMYRAKHAGGGQVSV